MTEITAEDIIENLNSIGTCMFTTVDASNRLVSRPMAVTHIDDDHRLWFFSSAGSEKVEDILGEGNVNLAFVADKTWISVAGTAQVVTDEQKKTELETMGAQAYFSEGAEDSEAVLLCVAPENAHYWEGPGKAAALVQLVKSSASKDTPNMGDSGSVTL